MMPQRIQRKRTKGWRLPANTKCVSRPGPWGNPFRVLIESVNAEAAVAEYEKYVARDPHLRSLIRRDLRGFNLACFCKEGEPCHADVLLRIANE